MSDIDADVVVVGGGPAGSTVANRLARLGYAVQLFETSAFPRSHVGESLHAQVAPLFDQLGVRQDMNDAGFLRPQGAVVLWGGECRLRTDLAEGYQVDRSRFDSILLNAARNAGARIAQPARVTSFTHTCTGSWELTVTQDGPARSVKCHFVIDATGRNGCLPGRRLRIQPPTIAFYAYWIGAQLDGDETLIEAANDHWYWAAPLPDGSVNATVFADPNRDDMKAAFNITDLYLQLLRDSKLLSGRLNGPMKTPVRACAAAASRIECPIGEDWMKIGEAAFTLDPLSSQGVQNAIMGGLQAAAVVNTILKYPDCKTAAMNFCRDRLAEVVERHSSTAARFYREQASVTPSRFWNARAASNVQDMTATATAPPRAPLLLNALLKLNPLASWLATPALLNDRIAWQAALHLPGHRPIIWLEGQSVAELLKCPRDRLTPRILLESWAAILGSNRAMRILRWLCENGYLTLASNEE